MDRKTRAALKALNAISSVKNNIENEAQTEKASANSVNTNVSNEAVTLDKIFEKLSGLDRIENKLDNLDNRVDLLEGRVATLEDNFESYQDQNTEPTSLKNVTEDLKKRLEILENKDRQNNIKIINLPANPWETNDNLNSKILGVLKHVNPSLTAENILESRRLTARAKPGQTPELGQAQQRPPPVLVKLNSATIAQGLLKQNKKLRYYATPNTRIVDDVSPITQSKRALLIPKMKQLREAGLFAFIPFGPVAKLVYKEGEVWQSIFPESI